VTDPELIDKLKSGEVLSQPFEHRKSRGFTVQFHYKFADATLVSASMISRLLKKRLVKLVVEGDVRKVVLNEDTA